METKENNCIKEEELESVDAGRRPSGTWVPVDEECKYSGSAKCPFDPTYRNYDNCPNCKHLHDD